MKSENRNTKQRIQQTALELFSKQGYSAVSIRDICKLIGIKESTIYYHFKNKQDIFQTLLLEVQHLTNSMRTLFDQTFEQITRVEEKEFVMVGLGFLEMYLLEEKIYKFIQLLMLEQHVNEDAAKLYCDILFDAPLKQNAEVFQKMMDRGYFHADDAKSLAIEYYGMIYLIFQKYFGKGEITPELKETAGNELAMLLGRFYRRYSVN